METGRVMEPGNKSTRGWDDEREVTVLQREKEEAHDYRYFPDPDLVPVEIKDDWLEDIKSKLCELPLSKQLRYVTENGLSDYDAGVLTSERSTAEFFEEVVDQGGDPKRACNIITQDLMKAANERGCSIADLGVSSENIAQLCKMVEKGDVSATAATSITEIMVVERGNPQQIAQEQNLIQKSDAGELEAIVDKILAENPNAVEDVTSGGKKSKKARGFLLGQVMQKTKGQANPKVVSEILNKKLG
jgi:aspartyl-tRNA(Asn)/glutamyl-tRNA(Gln) amidotransferase subunit B